MSTLPFSRGDLLANRAGKLSRAQHARIADRLQTLENDYRAHMMEALFVCVGTVLALWIGGLTMATIGPAAAIATLIMLAFDRLAGADMRRLRADIVHNAVTMKAGTVQLTTWLDRAGIKRYGVTVEKRTFRVKRHIYEGINGDVAYCVYYSRHSGEVLTIEPVA